MKGEISLWNENRTQKESREMFAASPDLLNI